MFDIISTLHIFQQSLEEEAASHQATLDKARDLCRRLCDRTKDSSTKFDLKSKLGSVERPFVDINKKIGTILLFPYDALSFSFYKSIFSYIPIQKDNNSRCFHIKKDLF